MSVAQPPPSLSLIVPGRYAKGRVSSENKTTGFFDLRILNYVIHNFSYVQVSSIMSYFSQNYPLSTLVYYISVQSIDFLYKNLFLLFTYKVLVVHFFEFKQTIHFIWSQSIFSKKWVVIKGKLFKMCIMNQ